MKDATSQLAPTATTPKNAPTHALYHIMPGKEGGKNFWTQIAVGFLNRDGSVNIRARGGAVLLPSEDYQLRVRDPDDGSSHDD